MVYQQFVAIGNALVPYKENLEENTNATFYVKGTVHEDVIKKIYPNLNIVLETDISEIFKALKNNLNSFLILPNILADHSIQKYGAHEFKVIDRFEEIESISTIGVNIYTAPLMVDILDKSLIKIGPATLK